MATVPSRRNRNFFPSGSVHSDHRVMMMSSIDITLVFLLMCLFPVSLFQSFVVLNFD